VFTAAERERILERLLALAEADDDVAGAAITGSQAIGAGDEWSDIDVAFAIRGELAPALERWTDHFEREFASLHHWDLPFRSTIYRVFLLPGWLEVDIAFVPAADFGPRGPNWHSVFGDASEQEAPVPPQRDDLAGLAWHHVLHARACIERGKPWQAEWLISGVRDYVLQLACLRLGHTTSFAKGADLLAPELTGAVEAALVRSLDEPELRRALSAAAALLANELERSDLDLALKLRPMLAEVAGAMPASEEVSASSSLLD
jgi:predicted nucleotidyltransferase